MKKYILSLDAGTTSSRAIVFDHDGCPVSTAQKEFTQFFPSPGRVEHDALEIWSTQRAVAIEAVERAGLQSKDIEALGITNQRETTVIWDRKTGKPIYNAIVWQDRRTAEYCDSLKRDFADTIQKKTGLIIDAYFSATKVRWILDNIEGARLKAEKGELAFGTVDTWLLWNLTGGKLHATDVTNASRTMLFNIHTLDWDEELLGIFGVPASMLPEVKSSSEVYGFTDGIFATPVAIAGIAGDQQSALFGQMCIRPGMVKNTYGTGCFMMMNTGQKPIGSRNNLLSTIAWKIGNETHYALEGSVFIAGAVVQWLRDGLGIIKKSEEVELIAANVESSGGVYFVPAFTGLGAPHWNQNARGTIVGLTRGSTSAHIARAALDSIAYQTLEVLEAMRRDAGIDIRELRVDGGATVNNQLMQFQSDLLQTRVIKSKLSETTALGAAYLAGLAVGYWGDIKEIEGQWRAGREFLPTMEENEVILLVKGWEKAVKAAKMWAEAE